MNKTPTQAEKVGSYLGYAIFSDSEGFFILGLNGLNQPKKIVFETLPALTDWIDSEFKRYLGR